VRHLRDDLLGLPGGVVAQIAAVPWSLTMKLCWNEVTGPVSRGTTVDTSALGCQDGRAMTARPPGECSAPTTKSVWPPNPE
jgi:hypothetical protein